MKEYPSEVLQELKKLSRLAYQRELDQHLAQLKNNFEEWGNKQIDGFKLSDHIHEFHQGASRKLYVMYVLNNKHHLHVARAVHAGVITQEELAGDLMSYLQPIIDDLVAKGG